MTDQAPAKERKNGKTSKADLALRIDKITELMAIGFDRSRILQFVSEKTDWNVSVRTVDNYIAQATERITEQADINLEYETGLALNRFDDLYRRNMGIQDYKAALNVQRERAKLLALYRPERSIVTTLEGPTGTTQEGPNRLRVDQISPQFAALYQDILDKGHTEYIMYGGRGSTKSSFTALVLTELLENNPTWHALIVRNYSNTLRNSVYSQLEWAIEERGKTALYRFTVSPLEIEYLPTGQKIYFRGADDPGKVKSIKTPFGSISLLWFEELDQLPGPQAVRKIEQSAIRGTDQAYIFKTFNPPPSLHNWANKYVQVPKESQYRHFSNYLEVPRKWLGQIFLDEANHLKAVNPDAYEHEYMGIPTLPGGAVFPNVELREITAAEMQEFDRLYYGLDWGYAVDPAHWVKLHYHAGQETIYIFDEFRALRMSNQDLARNLIDKKGMKPNDLLIADSAEPKSIADMIAAGLLCRGAEKGPDSVRYRIAWLRNRVKIVIDPKRAPHTAEEFLNYQFEQTRDGEFISRYPDKDNHAIDAVGYALNTFWRQRGK